VAKATILLATRLIAIAKIVNSAYLKKNKILVGDRLQHKGKGKGGGQGERILNMLCVTYTERNRTFQWSHLGTDQKRY